MPRCLAGARYVGVTPRSIAASLTLDSGYRPGLPTVKRCNALTEL